MRSERTLCKNLFPLKGTKFHLFSRFSLENLLDFGLAAHYATFQLTNNTEKYDDLKRVLIF
jgi:hypothetical protein